jgi:hypothetical protein
MNIAFIVITGSMVLVYIYFIDSESECIITSGSILVLADLTSLVEGDWEGQQLQKSKAKGKIKIVGVTVVIFVAHFEA